MDWSNLTILLTGGTGSFGRAFTEYVLTHHKPKKLIIFSRDELKQHEMNQDLKERRFDERVFRFFIGDVRDASRLRRAMHGIDIVIHAAALKHVPACEYNPFEAVKTNIMGAENIINAAIDAGVTKVVALSTDKAVNPVNLYGATKLCAEKLFIQGNSYAGVGGTRFCCVRYGNVIGSRGSIVPLFKKQKQSGRITVTDARMTRFWISLDQGVELVLNAIKERYGSERCGGEIYIPKIPSMKIIDLANAVAPECRIDIVGIRPGEKLHESLISTDEARHAVDAGNFYVIEPEGPHWRYDKWANAKALPDDFCYTSDLNVDWLTENDLHALICESSPSRYATSKATPIAT